jgi:hypothetical protein
VRYKDDFADRFLHSQILEQDSTWFLRMYYGAFRFSTVEIVRRRGGDPQMQTFTHLSFARKFPMRSRATVDLGKTLGGRSLVVQGNGYMTLTFEETNTANTLAIRLRDIELSFEPFELRVPAVGVIGIKNLRVSSEDFDLKASEGTLNLKTEEISLRLVFVLSPAKIPQLKELRVRAPLRLTAVERGHMSIAEGRFETHAEPFYLGGGLLKAATVHGGQFGCNATPYLGVALSFTPYLKEIVPSQVWICPGHSAKLGWRINGENNVTQGTISPIGFPIPIPAHHTGEQPVKPQTTTTY